MTYQYNAAKQGLKLIIYHQKTRGFPLEISSTIIRYLTKQMNAIFLHCQNDLSAVSAILTKIIRRKVKDIEEHDKANNGIMTVIKLLEGNPEIFNRALVDTNFREQDIAFNNKIQNKYILKSTNLIYCHINEVIYQINTSLFAPGASKIHKRATTNDIETETHIKKIKKAKFN